MANEAWEALFRAQMTIAGELNAGDAWGNLAPNDYGVLYALSAARDGLRMSELAGDVLLSQPGLSRLVGRLEAKGLVERIGDPSDARASIVKLSKEGRHLQRRVGAVHGRHVAQAMAPLNDEELKVLRDLSRKLLAAKVQRGGESK